MASTTAATSQLASSSIETVDRLAKIHRTAAAIIVRKGFDATSMNDIAAAMDLTKAGLYHYVRGKKDLLFSIMQFAMDLVDQEVIEPARQVDDPEQRLRFMLQRHAGMTQYVQELTILTEEVAALTDEHRDIVVGRKRLYLNFLRETLQALADEGKLRDLNVTVATMNVFGMVLGIARWYRPNGQLTAEQVADETARLLLGGLLRAES